MTWRPNLRARLAIASTVLTAVVLLLAVLFARQQIAAVYTDSAEQLAVSDLAPYVTDILKNPGETPDPASGGDLVLVVSPAGDRVVDTLPRGLADTVQQRAGADGTVDPDHDGDHRVTSGGAGDYVIAKKTVKTSAGTWMLWAARDVSARDTALAQIDLTFGVGGGLLLLVLAVGSWFLAGAALRPVETMRRRAENLGPDDLLPAESRDELGRLAMTLNTMVERVRDSAARERQMVSDAAHELRTPLAGLRSRLELAQRQIEDRERAGAELELAQASLERLSHLASNLLELARVEEGGPRSAHLSTGPQLERATLDVIDSARLGAANRSIDIDHVIELDPGVRVALDPVSFSRIVENLLSNALNAIAQTDAATGQISLELRGETGQVVLVVMDDGPGTPEAFLPHAFERFARPDDSRSVSGSGIGLALVEALARSAHGTAQVENTNPGFRATVVLPTA